MLLQKHFISILVFLSFTALTSGRAAASDSSLYTGITKVLLGVNCFTEIKQIDNYCSDGPLNALWAKEFFSLLLAPSTNGERPRNDIAEHYHSHAAARSTETLSIRLKIRFSEQTEPTSRRRFILASYQVEVVRSELVSRVFLVKSLPSALIVPPDFPESPNLLAKLIRGAASDPARQLRLAH